MARMQDEAPAEEVDFLRLRQLGKDAFVRLSGTPIDLDEWPGRVSLLSISNKFGCFAAGLNDAFVVASLQQLRTALNEGGGKNFEPRYRNSLSSPPVNIKFTSDGERFVVGTRDGRIRVYTTPRDISFPSNGQATGVLTSLHEVSVTDEPIRDIQANPSDKPELVAILRSNPAFSSVVQFLDTRSGQVVGSIPGSSGPTIQSSICWSPKGKQIAIGTQGGQLFQYNMEGVLKSTINPPAGIAAPLVSIMWIENTILAVAYREGEDEPKPFIIDHDPKTGATKEIAVTDDPTPPWGMESRECARSYVHLKGWEPTKHLLVMSDAPSEYIGLLAYFDGPNSRWAKLDLEETARGTVPLREEDSLPASLVGFDVDLTSTTPIPVATQGGDETPPLPPAPIVVGYTSEGIIIAYHVTNSKNDSYPHMLPFTSAPAGNPAVNVVSPPKTPPKAAPSLSFGSPATPKASTTPAGPPALGFGSFSTTDTKPAFGLPAASTASSSTTPLGTPNPPAPTFGQSAFGQSTFGQSGFGASTTPFGKPGFGSTTPVGFGTAAAKPAFGQASFGFGGAKPAGGAFGGNASGTGFAGFGNVQSASSTASTDASTKPADKPTTGGFAGFGSGAGSFGAATPAKKLELPAGSGAFGSGVSAPSIFGAAKDTPPPAFALPKPAAQGSTTPTGTPAGKPVFGSTTGFGGFGVSNAPKPSTTIPPVKVTAGAGFGGFSAGGFGGFAAKSGTSGGSWLQTGDAKTTNAFPNTPPESATSMTSSGSRGFAARSTDDDDDDDNDQEERFPEEELEAQEPTKESLPGLDSLDSPQPPRRRGGTDTLSVPSPAPSSAFSMMSFGTVKGGSSPRTPGAQSVYTGSSPGPSTGIPMSTTSISFPSQTSSPATSSALTPKTPARKPSADSDEEEGEEGEGEEDGSQPAEEDADTEGEEDDGEEFVISAPLSPVSEEGETETEGDGDEQDEQDASDSSYVFAERPARGSPLSDEMATTPRPAHRPGSREGSTTPHGSPNQDEPSPPLLSSESAQRGATENALSPPTSEATNRPIFGRGRSPFGSTPTVSSPLAAPPITGPSPAKSEASRQTESDVEQSPSKPGPSTVIHIPLPNDDEERSMTRTKTPPLPFLSFGGKPAQPKPAPSFFGGSGPSATPSTIFGGQPKVPTPAFGPPASIAFGSPAISSPKPVFGTTPFSFNAKPTSGPTPPPAAAKSTPSPPAQTKPPSGFVGFGGAGSVSFGGKPAAPSGSPSASPNLLPASRGSPVKPAVHPPSSMSGGAASPFGAKPTVSQPAKPASSTPPPSMFGDPKPPLSQPIGHAPASSIAQPSQPLSLEAQFLKIISQVEEEIQDVRETISQQKQRQIELGRKAQHGPKTEQDLSLPSEMWNFADLKSIRSIALAFKNELAGVDLRAEAVINEIAALRKLDVKLEAQYQELKRYVEMRDDATVAELVKHRELAPEQQENKNKLEQLYQLVLTRVEQLEDYVEAQKKRAQLVKEGKRTMKTPTLELISQSLRHIQSATTRRQHDLKALGHRIDVLAVEDDEDMPFSGGNPQGANPTASTAKFTSRRPVDPQIWAAAASALNNERAAARFKDVFLKARAGEAPRWNRTIKKREPVQVELKRTLKARPVEKPLPNWTKPSTLGNSGQKARSTQEVASGVGEANPISSFSLDSPQLGKSWSPKHAGFASATPPKMRPLPKIRRGYGLHVDDDDD